MDRLPNWLRWIMAFPVAFASFLGLNAIAISAMSFLTFESDFFLLSLLIALLAHLSSFFIFLKALHIFAPTKKKRTVIIGGFLISFLIIIGALFNWSPDNLTLSSTAWPIMFCIFFCKRIIKNDKPQSDKPEKLEVDS